jgi:hypothetical protein
MLTIRSVASSRRAHGSIPWKTNRRQGDTEHGDDASARRRFAGTMLARAASQQWEARSAGPPACSCARDLRVTARGSADSPEQARSLASMPPFKIVARGVGRDVAYTYADPANCRCLYVGGPRQFVEYQRLATERDVAEGELWAESDGMDWALWGGWLR